MKKPIVLLHGWGMNAAVFEPLRAEFSGDLGVWVPDLPGYGGTGPCEPYTVEQLAAALAREAPQSCRVVGWSLGAHIALHWARSRPDQVDRLAVLAGTPCFTQREDWPCAMASEALDAFRRTTEENVERSLTRFVSLQAQCDRAARRVAHALRVAIAGRPLPHPRALDRGLDILRDVDLRSSLAAIAQPTLVVHGEHDQLVAPAAARYLASALSRGRLEIIPGAAHAPFISNTQLVARLIMEHFDDR